MRVVSLDRVLVMAVIVALLVGCGQAGNQAPVNTAPTTAPPAAAATQSLPVEEEAAEGDNQGPCAIVTRAELQPLVDKPLTREEVDGPRCTYYTDDPLVFVTLEVDRENAQASWEGVTAGQDLAGAESNQVSGLGEQAFFGARDILYVRDGETFLMIEAGFDDKVRQRAQAVAKLVLDQGQ